MIALDTMILNQDFEQVDVSDLMSYIEKKELYVLILMSPYMKVLDRS